MRASAPPVDSLPGIDLPGFLDRFDGNFALLAGLLPRFVESTESRIGLLERHLKSGDLGEIAAVLHQLRGAAANVGANDMANLASRAEEAMTREGIEALRPLPEALAKMMVRLREAVAIVAALPQSGPRPQEGEAPIAELMDLLRTNNMRALDLVRDYAGSLAEALGAEEAEAVTSAVLALDFEDAWGKLSRLGPGGRY